MTPKVTNEEAFFLALSSASGIVYRKAEDALRKADLTVAEYTLLRIVENTPGVTAGEARARLYATAPSVAAIVSQLLQKGFLRRGSDPKDARRLPLRLSSQGQKVLLKAKKSVSTMLHMLSVPSKLLDSLTSDLTRLLSSLPPYGSK